MHQKKKFWNKTKPESSVQLRQATAQECIVIPQLSGPTRLQPYNRSKQKLNGLRHLILRIPLHS
jgi:hypothetical protein